MRKELDMLPIHNRVAGENAWALACDEPIANEGPLMTMSTRRVKPFLWSRLIPP